MLVGICMLSSIPTLFSDSHSHVRVIRRGKHVVEKLRLVNTAGHDARVNKTNVMPIVLIRDPYTWLQSMCKHKYAADWPHWERCPNLVPTDTDRFNFTEQLRGKSSVPVSIQYPNGKEYWDSLVRKYLLVFRILC